MLSQIESSHPENLYQTVNLRKSTQALISTLEEDMGAYLRGPLIQGKVAYLIFPKSWADMIIFF